MKYATFASGIETCTVAWRDLGWEPVFFSEIAPFPCALLKYHYPDVPNLGDMRDILDKWDDVYAKKFTEIDLLCAGTPCQDFSIAGLRTGILGKRGSLTLVYLLLIKKIRPKWVVWENVPGILSIDNGIGLRKFLDGLEELGYLCDVEILDAQFFGVPQRRRRIFVCAQSVDSILSQTTRSSALTICQCLLEILVGILGGQLYLSEKGQVNLKSQIPSEDGVKRRMRLFGIHSEKCNFKRLREILIEAFRKFPQEQNFWDLKNGKFEAGSIQADLLTAFQTTSQSILTEELLLKSLDDLYEVMKLFITLTLTNKITPQKTYTYLKAGLHIGNLIARLSGSCPTSLNAVLSYLTLSTVCTNYARQANRDLFSQLVGDDSWSDLIGEAFFKKQSIGYCRDLRSAASVLFEPQSLRRDFAPGKKALGEDARFFGSGIDSDSQRVIAMAGGQGRAEILEDMSPTLTLNKERVILCFQGKASSTQSMSVSVSEVSPALDASKSNGLCFVDIRNMSAGETAQTLTSMPKGPISNGVPHVYENNTLRRITPLEAERLQGLPDKYTLVPYLGKPAKDGPRYTAIGNGIASPVLRWVGTRLKYVNDQFHG